jgi:hypothetical protein
MHKVEKGSFRFPLFKLQLGVTPKGEDSFHASSFLSFFSSPHSSNLSTRNNVAFKNKLCNRLRCTYSYSIYKPILLEE